MVCRNGKYSSRKSWLPTERRVISGGPDGGWDLVVRRFATESVPPCVDYVLSDAGKELIPVMEAMCGWGTKRLGVASNLPRPVPSQI
jgi:hypothetical protein